MAQDQKKEMLALANQLNEKVLECEVILRKLNSLVRQSDNHDLKFLCMTELGDTFLGNNSAGSTVDKVVKKLEG